MCYNLWPWGPRGEVGFLSKNTQLFSLRTFLGVTRVPSSSAPLPSRGSNSFLRIYSKIRSKKSIFHGILKKNSTKTTPEIQKDSYFFQWHRVTRGKERAKRPGPSFKAAPRRPKRKGQNQCAMVFGLWVQGEKLGLSSKAT